MDLGGTLVDYDQVVVATARSFLAGHSPLGHISDVDFSRAWLESRTDLVLDGSIPLHLQRQRRMTWVALRLGVACDEWTYRSLTQAAWRIWSASYLARPRLVMWISGERR